MREFWSSGLLFHQHVLSRPFKPLRQWKWTEFHSAFQISFACWFSWSGSQQRSWFSWHKLTLELQFWC